MLRHCQRCQNTHFLQTSCPNPVKFGAKFFWSSSFATFLPRSVWVLAGGSGRSTERDRGWLERGGVCAQPGHRCSRETRENGRAGARAREVLKRPTLLTSRNAGAATTGPATDSLRLIFSAVRAASPPGEKHPTESCGEDRCVLQPGPPTSTHPIPCTPMHAHTLPCTRTDSRRHVTVQTHY